jgi:hypothetical protein
MRRLLLCLGLMLACVPPAPEQPHKVGVALSLTTLPVTWGSNSTYLPDGSVQVALLSGATDGGFQPYDAGIQIIDGGVCADGGLSCQACSGSCAVDAGILDPADGGWLSASVKLSSDWIPAQNNTGLAMTCNLLTGSMASGNVVIALQGSTDQQIAVPLDAGAYTLAAIDAGVATSWNVPQVYYPYLRVQTTTNTSDGGNLSCTQFGKGS